MRRLVCDRDLEPVIPYDELAGSLLISARKRQNSFSELLKALVEAGVLSTGREGNWDFGYASPDIRIPVCSYEGVQHFFVSNADASKFLEVYRQKVGLMPDTLYVRQFGQFTLAGCRLEEETAWAGLRRKLLSVKDQPVVEQALLQAGIVDRAEGHLVHKSNGAEDVVALFAPTAKNRLYITDYKMAQTLAGQIAGLAQKAAYVFYHSRSAGPVFLRGVSHRYR